MADSDPLRIFIGSGEASVVECQVLIHSLCQHVSRPLDIHVMNGTHHALWHDGAWTPLPMPLAMKLWSGDTEYGLYRWLLPALCGHRGRALYLDSDIVCLGDVAPLFDSPLQHDFLGLPAEFTSADGQSFWRSSVLPIDCARARFDLWAIHAAIMEGRFSVGDFMGLSQRFQAVFPQRIGRLDPMWNTLDQRNADTRLLHYTDMYRQPWKHPGHPEAGTWFAALRAALAAGVLTEAQLELALRRGHVRRDIRAVIAGAADP